jgi:hypothetical protein
MKTQKIFLAMAGVASMVAFTACSSDEADGLVSNSDVIKITSVLKQTRSTEDYQKSALSESNTVGVFVTSNGETIENGKNNKHTVSGTKLESTDAMVYPKGNNPKVSVYAYAPYADNFDLASANNFSVATDQSSEENYLASDLLYAKAEDHAKDNGDVKLSFTHQLSQLKINITNTAQDLTYATVKVSGTKVATSFNPSTGELGEATGEATDIVAASNLGDVTTVYAVVVPQELSEGTELVKIVTADKTFTAAVASGVTFEAGKAYSFNVSVNESSSTAVALNEVELAAWTEDTSISNATTSEVYNDETKLYADANEFTTEWYGSNNADGDWDKNKNTYKWINSRSNLMTIFKFNNGELANYKTLKFTLKEKPTNDVRMLLVVNSNKSYQIGSYTEAGQYEVDLVAFAKNNGFSLAEITRISFGGAKCKANCYWVDTPDKEDTSVVHPAAWESVEIDPASIYLTNY